MRPEARCDGLCHRNHVAAFPDGTEGRQTLQGLGTSSSLGYSVASLSSFSAPPAPPHPKQLGRPACPLMLLHPLRSFLHSHQPSLSPPFLPSCPLLPLLPSLLPPSLPSFPLSCCPFLLPPCSSLDPPPPPPRTPPTPCLCSVTLTSLLIPLPLPPHSPLLPARTLTHSRCHRCRISLAERGSSPAGKDHHLQRNRKNRGQEQRPDVSVTAKVDR